ncbi:hypothetical protein AAVH_16172 [Aphelenchoides avenae]|nr:hypothetical protein AAVH_16172 [Aphelenchus avenae]
MCHHTYDEYQRHPNRMSSIRLALFAAETMLNLFSLLTGIMFFFILRKTVIMRKNPRMLLHNLLLSNLLTVLTRFVIVANMISEDKLIESRVLYPIGFVHDVSINMNTLNQLCLALESTLSTFFTGLYKKKKCARTLSLLECLLPILIALALLNRYFYQHCLPGDVKGKFDTLNVLAVMTGMRNAITVGILEAILFHYTPRCDFDSARMLAHLFDLTVSVYSAFFVFPLLYVNAEFAKHFEYVCT